MITTVQYSICSQLNNKPRVVVTDLLNEAFLVKIVNSNVMPMMRGFRWYPYFGAQE